MKKRILGVAIIAAVAVAAGWNFNQSMNETNLSDLALANVEALAQIEDNHCPNGCLTTYDPKGCWCYRNYPNVKEKDWK